MFISTTQVGTLHTFTCAGTKYTKGNRPDFTAHSLTVPRGAWRLPEPSFNIDEIFVFCGGGGWGGDVSRVLASAFTSCYALGKEISHFYGMVCVYNFIPMTLNFLFIMTVKMKSE